MKYGVILTIDTSDYDDVGNYAPDKAFGLERTESLFETPDNRPSWTEGSHAKWYGHLDEEQFIEFLDEQFLTTNGEQADALGIVGMGLSKAIVFQGLDQDDVISEAWVTPYCSDEELVDWLQANREHVPSKLIDSPGQLYLFKGARDNREPFDAVVKALSRMYA